MAKPKTKIHPLQKILILRITSQLDAFTSSVNIKLPKIEIRRHSDLLNCDF